MGQNEKEHENATHGEGWTVQSDNETDPCKQEVVGVFADRESFEAAIKALMAEGFERTDLSVLASHDSIDAAGATGARWRDAITALVGELKYEVPLVASGAVFLAGGPIVATLAGLVGAAVGGLALKEVLEEVTATPNTAEFERALKAGSLILWVRIPHREKERTIRAILQRHGGANVHTCRYTFSDLKE